MSGGWVWRPWRVGVCFRCERSRLEVLPVGTLLGGAGEVEIAVCRACLTRLTVIYKSLASAGRCR